MGCIILGNNCFFKELASLVLQTEAIDCPEKYIPHGPEWILPLFDTAHIENSYFNVLMTDNFIDLPIDQTDFHCTSFLRQRQGDPKKINIRIWYSI